MLKNILIVMKNGVQFEVTNVVNFEDPVEVEFVYIRDQAGTEHYINKNELSFMSVKSAVDTSKIIT